MSSDAAENRSFEDKVQDRQDWIESQFRRISRGSWARIIRMARKPTAQEWYWTVCSWSNRFRHAHHDGQFLPLAFRCVEHRKLSEYWR